MRSTLKISLLPLLLQLTSATSAMKYPAFPLPSTCPTSCGSLSIAYPFGIGGGCFRPGFELSCNGSTSPPKLLLGQSGMELKRNITTEDNNMFIKRGITTVSIDVLSSYISLIDLPAEAPYTLTNMEYMSDDLYFQNGVGSLGTCTKLWIIGCSAVATLIDPTRNKILGVCTSLCLINDTRSKEDNFETNDGLGQCWLDVSAVLHDGKTKSLGIQITRLEQRQLHLKNDSTIKAYITSDCYIDDSKQLEGIEGETEVSLNWLINDKPTCEEAKKNQDIYACLSESSDCLDASINDIGVARMGENLFPRMGYVCKCFSGFYGNPYVPDGCQAPVRPVAAPLNDNCRRKCGKIDVPYPFGLQEGCYFSEPFLLFCTTVNRSILQMNGNYSRAIVSNIFLEEGHLELESENDIFQEATNMSLPFILINGSYMLSWVIQYQSCEKAKRNKATYACRSDQSVCLNANSTNYMGNRCKCIKGYEGNPYLPSGCKDINECNHPDKYICNGICINSNGSYSCTCPEGAYRDPIHGFCTSNKRQTLLLGLVIAVSTGVGILLLAMSFTFCARKWKRRKHAEIRRRHFRQNHGLLLQQLLSTNLDTSEKTKVFAFKDLDKATNNFDNTRILGRGGHGMVYKGILLDQRIIAVKKSKIVKKKEIDQFINEVVILSQVNHRHVVKLYGCCLETEVPLLVYEFISNGTLFDRLHNQNGSSSLRWDDRLRIATEAASALSYLHSASSISIFHRDVKSSNILLDDYYTAKVSDFGASRSIPHDQTHVLTAVQGTFGYLDPEYYQTGQLTEKSDVYSFGVILAELLTGKKPVFCTDHGEQVNLSMQFLEAIREERVLEILEACVVKDGLEEELNKVIQLAERCLQLKGDHRPTMTEVEFKLQQLRKIIRQERYWNNENGSVGQLQHEGNISNHKSVCNNLDNQATHGASRNYSLENEIMSSLKYAR